MVPAHLGGFPWEWALAAPGQSLYPCAQLSQVAEVGRGSASREAPVEAGQAPGATASSATLPATWRGW